MTMELYAKSDYNSTIGDIMYKESDYKVVSTYKGGAFKQDILNGATISVKGAKFKLEREYTRNGTPTSLFKFVTLNEFNEDGELIEIMWNNCVAGFMKIGRELGLDFRTGSSLFSNGNNKPHFVEVVK